MKDTLVEVRNITKTFPGVVANHNVCFDLKKGEVLALLGENGAGKSTLMNILYGLYIPTSGEIFINGKKVQMYSPADAIRNKIGMIHQHFMLIPTLTVAENIALGLKQKNPFRMDLKIVEKRAEELSKKYGLGINPKSRVDTLSVGEQQRVEILKVLYQGAEILIMDEPTAVLTPQEVEGLFQVIAELKKRNAGIIFISHKLWEVMKVSDRVTILRDGESVGTVNTCDVTSGQLAEMMVGRPVELKYEHKPNDYKDILLKMEHVNLKDTEGFLRLNDLNLQVKSGEIVGIAGVDGNGQRELAEVIHGLKKVSGGKITFLGENITNKAPKYIYKKGLSHIPEDRHKTGLVLDFSVEENLVLQDFDQEPYTKHGIYRLKEVHKKALEMMKDFDIRCAGPKTAAGELSGGNQQKIILARETGERPKLIIAAQPSRGLDIGATQFIQKKLLEERDQGKGVLLIDTDLDEVLAVSDRVLVIFEGHITGEIIPGKASFEEIGLLMAGAAEKGETKDGYKDPDAVVQTA